MPTIDIDEKTVARLLSMEATMQALRDASRALAAGDAAVRPRQRVMHAGTTQQILPATLGGRFGFKHYLNGPAGVTFRVMLFEPDGTWLATIAANTLGQIRTGAASGLATELLARPDARSVAILGTGFQSHTQLEAILLARDIDEIRVWGRSPDKARAFAEAATAKCGKPVRVAATAHEAVDGIDIVATMTSAAEPVLEGAWLAPGTHVNAAGSNRLTNREIDAETVRRASVIVVENLEQAHMEAGDLVRNEEAQPWERVVAIADLVVGTVAGRTNADDVTLFESLGIGLWDLAAANIVYDAVVAERTS